MPPKHEGPISYHSSPTTAAAWSGPTHRKCRKIVTYSEQNIWNKLQYYFNSNTSFKEAWEFCHLGMATFKRLYEDQ